MRLEGGQKRGDLVFHRKGVIEGAFRFIFHAHLNLRAIGNSTRVITTQ